MGLGPRGTPFTPYGPWSTVGLAAAILYGSALLSWMLMTSVGAAPSGAAAGEATLAYAIIANLIGIAAVAKLTDLRAPGQSPAYLALRPFTGDDGWRWLGIAAAFFAVDAFAETVLRDALGIAAPSTWLDDLQPGLLYVMAIVITGPIFEEMLARGFVMEGLMRTRLGVSGALVLSTLAWTLLHSEYDVLSLMLVFLTGLIFGAARLATGSLLLSIALHMAWNAMSVLLWHI
ncbi:MAG: lysostaphin resistance A-like protein [Sphingomonadales bacterium]